MKKYIPDFFILGAPKCGTTALSYYLSEHPSVCFSKPKEPNFFCSDFPSIQKVKTQKEYSNCFSHCNKNDISRGEGSVWYLYSTEAIPSIVKKTDHAKFIIMVRSPVDASISLYNQKRASLQEDQKTFEAAWNLQEARRNRRSIPRNCKSISQLLYYDVFLFSEQIKRLYSHTSKENCLILFFDDLVSNPKMLYDQVLNFLSVPNDHRSDFPRVNERYSNKFELLAKLARTPPPWLKFTARLAKRLLGKGSLGLSEKINLLNTSPATKPFVSSKLYHEMKQAFSDEIIELEKITGKDLSSWKS